MIFRRKNREALGPTLEEDTLASARGRNAIIEVPGSKIKDFNH
jgi:hypothetical protein